MISGKRRPSGIGEFIDADGDSEPRRGGVDSILLLLDEVLFKTFFSSTCTFEIRFNTW